MIRADARLRVVLVNHNGGELLERAVRSALASQWPGDIDVVIVDNASTDGSLDAVEDLPGVFVIQRPTNEGFGANNHGFADLVGDELEVDLPEPGVVALLNPDAMVRPDTFRRLAATLDETNKVGAASPLIIFDRPFLEVAVTGETLVIDSVSCDSAELASQCHGVDGAERLPGVDQPIWLCPAGSILRIPVSGLGTPVVVGVRSGIGTAGGHPVAGPTELVLDASAHRTFRIVQNAGVEVGDRGAGINRGFATRVDEDLAGEASLWCGAAVVLHPEYLRTVGGFDPEYFLYYEDVDLGLRGQAHGWKTAHVPEAVVEHRHSDRTTQGTELVEVLQHRNRLLTLVRHGSAAEVAAGYARAIATPLSLAASAVRNPNERDERMRLAKWRARSLREALIGVPKARAAKAEHTAARPSAPSATSQNPDGPEQ